MNIGSQNEKIDEFIQNSVIFPMGTPPPSISSSSLLNVTIGTCEISRSNISNAVLPSMRGRFCNDIFGGFSIDLSDPFLLSPAAFVIIAVVVVVVVMRVPGSLLILP
jgi:hypothetical protein